MWPLTCGGCGWHTIRSIDDNFKYIEPWAVLHWAHSIVNLVNDKQNDIKGLTYIYYITCKYEVSLSRGIAPKDSPKYSNSDTYRKELIKYMVSDLAHQMILYTNDRITLRSVSYIKLEILSLEDLNIFKESMKNQRKFSAIHAALNEIDIDVI